MEFSEEDDYEDIFNESDFFNYSYSDYPTVCDKEEVRTFGKVFLPIIYALALIIGLAGNSLVVAIYIYYKKLKTMTDVYIFNLAIADLLLLFTLPFWAADAVHGWKLGETMCKITSMLYVMNFSCGMFFLACISVDRYLAIKTGRIKTNHCLFICFLVWATSFILGIPELIFSTVKMPQSRKICISVYPSSMARPAKATLEILEVLLSFVIPFLIMLFCYSKVSQALWKTANVKKWKAFKVLMVVVGVFIVTQLPFNIIKFCRAMDIIYILITQCEDSKRLDKATQITESMALLHSCVNPIIYAFVGASFKHHIARMFKSFSYRQRRRKEPENEISLNSETGSQITSSFTI
ncbi:atypical chemokine receptor 4 [Lepisosteus oculatus]|uniref:atypical chemokine receptor 4 n=1 Tax=Lepisosteus oculatus TaxID=7918 RepID=UPI0037153971